MIKIQKSSQSPQKPYPRKFRESWQEEFPWLLPGETIQSSPSCTYCQCKLKNLKKDTFRYHDRTVKHMRRRSDYIKRKFMPQENWTKEAENERIEEEIVITSNNSPRKSRAHDNGPTVTNISKARTKKISVQPNNEERIINDVTSLFTCDVHRMFKDDPAMRDLLVSNPELQNTAAGIGTLTKLLIGELAQKYLKENLMKLGTNSNPPEENLKSQIGEVEKKILEATTMLEKLKGKLPGTGGDTVIEISPEAFEEIPM